MMNRPAEVVVRQGLEKVFRSPCPRDGSDKVGDSLSESLQAHVLRVEFGTIAVSSCSCLEGSSILMISNKPLEEK